MAVAVEAAVAAAAAVGAGAAEAAAVVVVVASAGDGASEAAVCLGALAASARSDYQPHVDALYHGRVRQSRSRPCMSSLLRPSAACVDQIRA